jgi:hypothetical protein
VVGSVAEVGVGAVATAVGAGGAVAAGVGLGSAAASVGVVTVSVAVGGAVAAWVGGVAPAPAPAFAVDVPGWPGLPSRPRSHASQRTGAAGRFSSLRSSSRRCETRRRSSEPTLQASEPMEVGW